MSKTTTRDFSAFEEDAKYWLSVFESIPDGAFSKSEHAPHSFIVNKIKAFARAYTPVRILGNESGVIIN